MNRKLLIPVLVVVAVGLAILAITLWPWSASNHAVDTDTSRAWKHSVEYLDESQYSPQLWEKYKNVFLADDGVCNMDEAGFKCFVSLELNDGRPDWRVRLDIEYACPERVRLFNSTVKELTE